MNKKMFLITKDGNGVSISELNEEGYEVVFSSGYEERNPGLWGEWETYISIDDGIKDLALRLEDES